MLTEVNFSQQNRIDHSPTWKHQEIDQILACGVPRKKNKTRREPSKTESNLQDYKTPNAHSMWSNGATRRKSDRSCLRISANTPRSQFKKSSWIDHLSRKASDRDQCRVVASIILSQGLQLGKQWQIDFQMFRQGEIRLDQSVKDSNLSFHRGQARISKRLKTQQLQLSTHLCQGAVSLIADRSRITLNTSQWTRTIPCMTHRDMGSLRAAMATLKGTQVSSKIKLSSHSPDKSQIHSTDRYL